MQAVQRALRLLAIPIVLSACAAAADAPQPADHVLAEAEATAAAEHKNVWVIFGASWCGWCHKLDGFINAPEVRPVLEQYFVIAHITVDEHGNKTSLDSPGGDDVRKRLGGDKNSGLPFFAFLDSADHVLVNSNRPVASKPAENIGFPSAPEEVDWFLMMLHRAAPSLGAEQARMIEARLRSPSVH
jgi:thiol-disulfide isomerase/thioredoxin